MNQTGTVTFVLKAKDMASQSLKGIDKEVDSIAKTFDKLNKTNLNNLEAEEQQVEQGLKEINYQGSQAEASLSSMNAMSFGLLASSTAMLSAALFDAVKNSVNFSFQMDKLQAVTEATDDEMTRVSNTILDLGAKTTRTNSEIATTAIEMGKLGFSASEVADALPGVVRGAEATGESLESMGSLIVIIQKQFGLAVDSATELADAIVVAANKSAAGTQYLIDAFKYAGPPAAALGVDLYELAAAMMVMADSGLDASQAGTTLRSVLTRLASPTSTMQKTMEELGVSAFDAEGNFLGLQNVLLQFSDVYDDLSQEQQAFVANQVAGKTALSGFLVLVESAPDTMKDYEQALRDSSGAAEEASAAMRDNLIAQLNSLAGSIEAVAIKLLTLLEPALLFLIGIFIKIANIIGTVITAFDTLVGSVIGFVDNLGEAIFGTKIWSAILDSLSIALKIVVGYLIAFVVYQKAYSIAVTAANVVTKIFTSSLLKQAIAFALANWYVLLIVAALGLLYTAYKNNEKVQEIVNSLLEIMGMILDRISRIIQTQIIPVFEKFNEILEALRPIIEEITAVIKKYLILALQELADILKGVLAPVLIVFKALLENIILPAFEKLATVLETVVLPAFAKLADFLSNVLIPALATLANVLINYIVAAFKAIYDWLKQYIFPILVELAKILKTIATIFYVLAKTIIESIVIPILSALFEVIKTLIPIFKTLAQIIIQIAAIIKAIVVPILKVLVTILTTIVIPVLMFLGNIIITVVNAALNVLAWILENIVLPAFEGISNFLQNVVGPVFKSIADIINNILNIAFNALGVLLDNFILPILEGINAVLTKIKDIVIKVANAISNTLNAAFVAIQPALEFFENILNSIQTALQNLFGWISNVANAIGGLGASIAGAFDSLTFWNREMKIGFDAKQMRAYSGGFGFGELQGRSLSKIITNNNDTSNVFDNSKIEITVNSTKEAQEILDNNSLWKQKLQNRIKDKRGQR